uniref:collagen alpha-1(XII) chain-like isoform X1 n=2 Tax=Styela clava TaxID=7725 RepID=UPI0019394472|nr:collagen alpha-1(XII) chain-like isoform X1 [Styela clava]
MKQNICFVCYFWLLYILMAKGSIDSLCQPESPPIPDNGKVWCNDSNNPNSMCMFTCEPYHTLVGTNKSVCVETINETSWTKANLECSPDHCEPEINSLPNGVVTCSHGNKVRSVCHYKCTTTGTSMFSGMKNTNRCLPSKKWDVKPPCCQAPCPSNAKMDAVIIMDSSSSLGIANWVILFEFIQKFIRAFPISKNLTRFAMFRYNMQIDVISATRLEDYDSLLDGLLYRMNSMEYDGRGTYTGMALQYAEEKILRSAANRPDARDLVILLTDGRPQDDVNGPSKRIREMGGTIILIAIRPPSGYLPLDELYKIPGDPSNVLVVDAGYIGLDDEFLLLLINKICNDLCINSPLIQ